MSIIVNQLSGEDEGGQGSVRKWVYTPFIIGAGAIAVLSGVFVSYLSYFTGITAIYYLLALVLLIFIPLIVITRDHPMQYMLYALLIGLPVVAFIVPPGRLGVSIFDYSMLLVLLTELWRRATNRQATQATNNPFFPTLSLMLLQLLAIPIVLMANSLGIATWVFLENFLAYLFFLMLLREIQSDDGGERMFFIFSIAVTMLAVGVFFQTITGISLIPISENLNQLTHEGGLIIYRPGGFFQDPQKAAQFFSCAGVLLLTLGWGQRFSKNKIHFAVWVATVSAFIALFLTLSRSALLAGVISIPFIFFFGVRRGIHIKTLAFIAFLGIMLSILFIPNDILIGMLPEEVKSRFSTIEESLFFRIRIWFDTWKMFADQPITGIGLGGFESYLLAENPSMKNYMGIGNTQAGIFIPGQPESGYFKILYEGGLLGSLATFLLVIAAFRRAFLVLHSPDALPKWKTEVVGSLVSLLVFGLSFTTLFTLSDERNIVILVLPLAIIWARSMALDTVLKEKIAFSISQRKRRFS